MARRYTRQQVLERLRSEVRAGRPIIMFGAGIGLTARCAELGGADLIGIYSTALYRMMGKPSLLAWLPYSNVNEDLLRIGRGILGAVRETPCIAGIGAHDPGLDLNRLLDETMAAGFSGVTNEPFVGMYGPEFASQLEAAGIGFSREVALVELAHRKDILTVAWVFTPEEARAMAEAGADCIGAMVGVTAGGLTGAQKTLTLEEATAQVERIGKAAREINPDMMVLSHGGPFKDVETAEHSMIHSGATGYAAGSSGERIPTEKAIVDIVRKYKAMKTG